MDERPSVTEVAEPLSSDPEAPPAPPPLYRQPPPPLYAPSTDEAAIGSADAERKETPTPSASPSDTLPPRVRWRAEVGSFAPIRPGQRRMPGATTPDGTSGPPPGYGPGGSAAAAVPESTAPDAVAGADAVKAPEPADVWTAPAEAPEDETPYADYELQLNGEACTVERASIGESLLFVLRHRLGMPGTKDGCGVGECGACTVLLDGAPVASCLVPAMTAQGAAVRTVEGLGRRAEDLREALIALGSVQCGFCLPGVIVTAHELLLRNPTPSDLDVREALAGNLCRCTGYGGIVDAVLAVARARQTLHETGAVPASVPDPAPEGTGIAEGAGGLPAGAVAASA